MLSHRARFCSHSVALHQNSRSFRLQISVCTLSSPHTELMYSMQSNGSTTGTAQGTYGGRRIWLNKTPASWSVCIYSKALGASLSCRIFVTASSWICSKKLSMLKVSCKKPLWPVLINALEEENSIYTYGHFQSGLCDCWAVFQDYPLRNRGFVPPATHTDSFNNLCFSNIQ